MKTFRLLIVTTLAAPFLLCVACASNVPIGALISETGAAAVYGEQVRKGIELALDEINADGGYAGRPFEVVFMDDGTNVQIGMNAANELISTHGTKIIIGAVSSPVTLAVAPICEQKKVLLLSPTASAPDITDAGEYIFRAYPSDILEGTAMANFARDLGLERMVVFAVDNEFGGGLKRVFIEKFESRFRKVVKAYDFQEGQADELTTMVEECKKENPDGIYIAGYLSDIASIVTAAREAGMESVILTASSVTDTNLVPLVGTAAENLIFPLSSTFDSESDDPVVRKFIEGYRAKFNEEPDNYAAKGYDSLRLVLHAMRQMESTHPANIKLGLIETDDFPGASGRIAFDRNGDVVQYPRLFVIRQGRRVPYEQFKNEGGTVPIPGQS